MFSEILVSLRKETGLSQEKIARKCDTSLLQYRRFEKGEQKPGFDKLIAIANCFNVSLDYLVGRSSKKEITDPISTPQSETQFRG